MPIEVTPVKEVNIDLANAKTGDDLVITLDDGKWTRIFLTAIKNPFRSWNKDAPKHVIGIVPELMPFDAYLAVRKAAKEVIRLQPSSLQPWYAGLQNPMDLYTELLSGMFDDQPAVVRDVQIGSVPTIVFNRPFHFGNINPDLTLWQPDAPIKSIAAVTDPWIVTQAIGNIRAERELHALGVR